MRMNSGSRFDLAYYFTKTIVILDEMNIIRDNSQGRQGFGKGDKDDTCLTRGDNQDRMPPLGDRGWGDERENGEKIHSTHTGLATQLFRKFTGSIVFV